MRLRLSICCMTYCVNWLVRIACHRRHHFAFFQPSKRTHPAGWRTLFSPNEHFLFHVKCHIEFLINFMCDWSWHTTATLHDARNARRNETAREDRRRKTKRKEKNDLAHSKRSQLGESLNINVWRFISSLFHFTSPESCTVDTVSNRHTAIHLIVCQTNKLRRIAFTLFAQLCGECGDA